MTGLRAAGSAAGAGFLDLLFRGAPHEPPPATAILIAHPDDEVIGAGARLGWLAPSLRLIHATDGAPRTDAALIEHGFACWQDYAAAREAELAAALALVGVTVNQSSGCGIPDQQASFHLVALAHRFRGVLADRRVVMTHPYEGGHPDHDAVAFAVHAACALLRGQGETPPLVIEMASYHGAGGNFQAGAFLAADRPEVRVTLSAEERKLKQRLFVCFRTQARVLAQFTCAEERYRTAPLYRFTESPHPGTLYYEKFDWGMDGPRFRGLAAEALRALGLEEPL